MGVIYQNSIICTIIINKCKYDLFSDDGKYEVIIYHIIIKWNNGFNIICIEVISRLGIGTSGWNDLQYIIK